MKAAGRLQRCGAAAVGLRRIGKSLGITPVSAAPPPSTWSGSGRGGRARRSSKAGGEKECPPHADVVLEQHNLDALAAAVEQLALGASLSIPLVGIPLVGIPLGDASHQAGAHAPEPLGSDRSTASKEEEESDGVAAGGWPDSASPESAVSVAGERGVEEGQQGWTRIRQELVSTRTELDKTKHLFSRAMLNAAALEMDIKKLQESTRIDKSTRDRVVAALVKITSLVGHSLVGHSPARPSYSPSPSSSPSLLPRFVPWLGPYTGHIIHKAVCVRSSKYHTQTT